MKRKALPYYLFFLLRLFLVSILVLIALRIFLLWFVSLQPVHLLWPDERRTLLIGLQFDAVVLSYFLALPLLLLAIQHFYKHKLKPVLWLITIYFTVVFPIGLFLVIADIPYFKFFHNRLTESAFQWMGNPEIVISMIMENKENLIFLLVNIALSVILGIIIYKHVKSKLFQHKWQQNLNLKIEIPFFLISLLLCFAGLRGKIDRPIRQGDAFFGNDPILNQIGLNPVYTLIKSYTDKVNLMPNEEAISKTINYMNIENDLPAISPIARTIHTSGDCKKNNIILVLMESMSANYLTRNGNPNHLTPTLDSIIKQSWYFENAYSAGIHTNNGVFSTLYSFPALKRIRPMSMVPARLYSGIPFVLKQQGYHNIFFTSHDETFDNLGTFIPANSFNKIYSAKDYPAEKRTSTFGVADDYLFSYALETMDQIKTSEPFFATILTTSNHVPYNVPENYKSDQTEMEYRAVSYADWSINQFLQKAQKSKWYANTLFIFVADHGLVVGENPYDLTLSYNHIPLIFHAPVLLGEPIIFNEFIGQIDIGPTALGILNIPFLNNTLGTDVIKNPRPCIYFSADNKIGCLNSDWLYVYRFDGGGESLYHYRNGDLKDYLPEQSTQRDRLRDYSFSQIQTAEYFFTKDKAKIEKK